MNCPLCNQIMIENRCSSPREFEWYNFKYPHYREFCHGFEILSHNFYIYTSLNFKATEINIKNGIKISIPFESNPLTLFQEITEDKIELLKFYA